MALRCNEPDSGYDPRFDFDGSSTVDNHDLHIIDLFHSDCPCTALCTDCERTHQCPGDVNGDGAADGLDIDLFTRAFGTTCGHPRYTPTADFNSDNAVDETDEAVFLNALENGVSCP